MTSAWLVVKASVWLVFKASAWLAGAVCLPDAGGFAAARRGRNAPRAIEAHIELAREVLAAALTEAPREPLIRGDELIRAVGVRGPALGRLLAQLAEDRYAGAIATREDAIARARELAAGED